MTLKQISDAVWSPATVFLILSVGAYYTIKLGAPQFKLKSLLGRQGRKKSGEGEGAITPLQSLSTSLAATVGTGSIIGVATAITLGGSGAVFWLWVSAFFGMAVAYAEGFLSIEYREKIGDERRGGIWYALEKGLNAPKTAKIYALFTVFASFGMGCMAQTNSAAEALFSELDIPKPLCGAAAAALLALCLIKKSDFCGALCSRLVPFLAIVYVIGSAAVIALNFRELPAVMSDIFRSALGFKPIFGGAAGHTVKTAISVGCRRGIFSNEAGLGTTAAVHASSSVDDPAAQGAMNMVEVVIDTFVICTLTALAILCAGADSSGADGAGIVIAAAKGVFGGFSGKFVALAVAGFALATAVGWSQIGKYAAEYLSPKNKRIYAVLYLFFAFLGTVMTLDAVFELSDIFNGLMVVPCMAALILLSKEVVRPKAFPSSRSPECRARCREARQKPRPRGKSRER